MRERFSKAKRHDQLGPKRLNRIQQVTERNASPKIVNSRVTASMMGSFEKVPWKQFMIRVSTLPSSPGLYIGNLQSYNHSSDTWEYSQRGSTFVTIDTRGLGIELSPTVEVVCHWDSQRGAFVPTNRFEGMFRLLETLDPGWTNTEMPNTHANKVVCSWMDWGGQFFSGDGTWGGGPLFTALNWNSSFWGIGDGFGGEVGICRQEFSPLRTNHPDRNHVDIFFPIVENPGQSRYDAQLWQFQDLHPGGSVLADISVPFWNVSVSGAAGRVRVYANALQQEVVPWNLPPPHDLESNPVQVKVIDNKFTLVDPLCCNVT